MSGRSLGQENFLDLEILDGANFLPLEDVGGY